MRNVKKETERLAALPYSVEVLDDETTNGQHIFMARCVELDGCMAQGATIEEAMENLRDATKEYIESLLEDGLTVPLPKEMSTSTRGTSEMTDIVFFEEIVVEQPSTFLGDLKRVTEKESRQKLYEVVART